MARRGGWRRAGRKGRFRYLDSRGRPITDREKIARIEELVIPPAWRDVWVSPRPKAKLQAIGVDRAGRRVRPRMDMRAGNSAYQSRLVPGGHGALRAHDQDLRITTLRKSHVSVRGSRITFRYRGKHRVWVRTAIVDDELASAMKELLQLPGGRRLFRYRYEDSFANLTGARLNEYINEHLGEEFTAKDFRTWGGTLLAAIALAERDPAETETEAKRVVAGVMRAVGERLGNTPAVARSSYVSPAVVEQYLDGRTIDDFRPRHLRVVGARDRGLDPEERALLALLRSWRIRRARLAA
jgi:DNA topoisomerase-1